MRNIKILFALSFILNTLWSMAQSLTVDQNIYTPQQLVEDVLVSGCVEVSNITYNDPSNNSIGYFNGNGGAFPLTKGIFFGTVQNASSANGPNSSGSSSSAINGGGSIGSGDVDLHNINGGTISEAAILEFDFIPQSDTLRFSYTFASEEYPEYECSAYNDVFGFFLSGPNPSGGSYSAQNIALVPNTSIPVGINSVNTGNQWPGTYPTSGCNPSNPYTLIQYMEDCTDPTWGPNPANTATTALDGYTVKLTAFAIVEPCQTYHIKLAIGDVGDSSWDSGIFLEAGSFASGTSVQVEHFANNIIGTNIVEDCDNYFVITRDDTLDTSSPLVVNYNISGSLTMGTDIVGFPTTITIPAGQTSITIPYSALADGITEGTESFIFSYIDGCFCTGGADTIFITVHDAELPLPEISPDATVCIGEDFTINLFENNPNLNLSDLNITWSDGSTDSLLNITANSTETYSAHIIFGCGFDTILYNTITANVCSFSVMVNDTAFCQGGTANINLQIIDGESPFTYQWSNGLPATMGPHSVSPSTTTNYIVTVTDATGYTATDTATITIFNGVSTEVMSTNISCFGLSDGEINLTVLNPTGTYTYNWESNGTNISTDEDLQNLSAGLYNVTIIDTNTCSGTNSVNIIEPSQINLITNPTNIICYGDNNGQINLTINGGTLPYNYNWNNGDTIQNINNLIGGVYTVTVTDANNCSVTSTVDISTIDEPLQLSYNTVNNICFGENNGSINTTVSGGTQPYSYYWTHSLTDENIADLYSGTYSVTVSDANNCTITNSINITQPNNLITSLPTNTIICANTDLNLQSSTSGGTTPYQYYWNTGNVVDNITINITDSSYYSITVTDANNCTTSDIVSIKTFGSPNIYTVSDKDTVCPGDPVTISSTITGGANPYTYTINGDIANLEQTVYPNQVNTYQTQVTDACGNTNIDNISIYTYNIPSPSISSDILHGCPPLTVNFNEGSNFNGAIYNWSFGNIDENNYTGTQNPTHVFDQSGTYDVSLEIITEEGCRAQQTISDMITVFPQPEAMFEATPEVVSFINPVVYFYNLSTNNNNNYWYFGDGQMSDLTNPVHDFLHIGFYDIKLIVESKHGCLDSAYHQIEVQDEFTIYVPTAFSPDNDGINDGFKVVGHGIDADKFELRIYNRWGEIIWSSTDLYKEWNGIAKNNKLVQTGTYKWLVVCKDFNGVEHTKSGNVTVIR